MKTIILAGGLGTRLKGVLEDVPKPMAAIGGRPFLEYVVRHFQSQGFSEFVMSTGHGAEKIRAYFGDGARFGLDVQYTIETELLGTAGALKLAEPLIDSGDFFVANGDTYFEVNLREMIRCHREWGAHATLALAHVTDAGRYGSVIFETGNRVTAFMEKKEKAAAGLINGGVYVFSKDVLDMIRPGKVCSLEHEILPSLVGKGLYGFPADGYFIDIGIPEDYERAKKELSLRRAV